MVNGKRLHLHIEIPYVEVGTYGNRQDKLAE